MMETEDKRVILIGMGPNAMRTYIPYFKKYGIQLSCVVDLDTEADRIQHDLDAMQINAKIISVPSVCRDDLVLNADTKRELNRVIDEEHIQFAVINSEPKSHYAYAMFFLAAKLHVLLEKPIVAPQCLSIYRDVALMGQQYDDILAAAQTSHRKCMVMCQRRMNYGYDVIRGLASDIIRRYNVPITEIEINHCDGNWMLPQDLFYENHPYQYGYGKLYHSGYHFVDLLAQMLLLNNDTDEGKHPAQAYITTDAQTVSDEMAILPPRDIQNIFQVDSLPPLPGSRAGEDFSAFGEKNMYSQLALVNRQGKTITVAQLGIAQMGFSRRAWLLAKEDHYKGNGRIRHEYVNIQIGPLMNIRVCSFQSKEISERTDCEYLCGGLDHFDIEIFRNSGLIGGSPYEKLDCRGILKGKPAYGLREINEISRVRMLHSFFFDKEHANLGIASHQFSMKLMLAITEGIIHHKNGERKSVSIDLTNNFPREACGRHD